MKTKLTALLGGICFATLFYDQRLGLNCLLYAVFLMALLIPKYKLLKNKRSFQLSGLSMLLTSIAMLYHGSDMTIYFYFFSCLLFIGYAAQSQVSSYIAFVNGIYTTLFGKFHNLIYNRIPEKVVEPKKYDTAQVLKLIFIPLILVLLFVIIYYQINPVFQEWINRIDLGFINFLWLLCVIAGSWITANVSVSETIEEWTQQDLDAVNNLKEPTAKEIDTVKTNNEIQTGTFSMIALNVLLVILLVSEIIFIVNLNDFNASHLSDAVHSGVYASISSIVIAIVLILVFFRGSINFVQGNKNLKRLAYLWIALNALLILSVLSKTYIYIDGYGLTIKRIGVLMYLTLCIIGLITTYFKIDHKLNLIYLLRRNVTIGFASLMLFSLINWSGIITSYNITHNYISMRQLSDHLPQNAYELKQADLLPEVLEYQRKNFLRKQNIEDFKNRNWQEYNYIASKINKTETDAK